MAQDVAHANCSHHLPTRCLIAWWLDTEFTAAHLAGWVQPHGTPKNDSHIVQQSCLPYLRFILIPQLASSAHFVLTCGGWLMLCLGHLPLHSVHLYLHLNTSTGLCTPWTTRRLAAPLLVSSWQPHRVPSSHCTGHASLYPMWK